MSHSARSIRPWPSSAQFSATSPSLLLKVPRTFTVSVVRPLVKRQVPYAASFWRSTMQLNRVRSFGTFGTPNFFR